MTSGCRAGRGSVGLMVASVFLFKQSVVCLNNDWGNSRMLNNAERAATKKRKWTGRWVAVPNVGGEVAQAFVPAPLPPRPALRIDGPLRDQLDNALVALGRLDSVATLLPDPHLLLYTYIRREAVLSSQIEGTKSSLSDLLMFELAEAPGIPLDDVTEVSNYVAALAHGLARVREGFPLSNRLLCELHAILLRQGRGADKRPGEFRQVQNWIGGSRPSNADFVPPPWQQVPDAMAALEAFLHDRPERTPTLVKAALAHVQFETIHPFLDGNGRIGRLLITLILCAEGLLSEPLLYLSLFLKEHRSTYYDLLSSVRVDGDWERWLSFFAEAVTATAQSAVATARSLADLAAADQARLPALGRTAGSALRIHHALRERPLTNIASLAERTGLTIPTVTKALEGLEMLAIVREITGQRRNRVWVYTEYLGRLNEDTEGAR